MKSAVITYPGSNCDRDTLIALHITTGRAPLSLWYQETELPPLDLIVIPGGFSYGDYLRSGAMAARAPIMAAVKEAAVRGVGILGICNGFQILTEAQLLPGALLQNTCMKFLGKRQQIRVESTQSRFTSRYQQGQVITCPMAHGDGRYSIEEEGLKALQDHDQIAFRYVDAAGNQTEEANPNGSMDHIAGIFNPERNILGMMPHPERATDKALGMTDGIPLFLSLLEAMGS